MSDEFNTNNENQYTNSYNQQPQDVPSTVLNLVSCCFPIVGLILFIVWKDQKPISAKSVGKWALIGVGITVVCYILSFALGFGSIMMFM